MPEDTDVNGDVDKDKDQPVTFTDAQQTLLNSIIDKAYTKAYTKAEEAWKPKLEALTTQVEDLKKTKPATTTTTVPTLTTTDKKPDDKVDSKDTTSKTVDIDAIMARLDEVTGVANSLKADKEKAELEVKAERQKNKEARIKEAYYRAADKMPNQFFDRMDVFSLIQQDLELDDAGEVVIMNPKTRQPRISGADPERNLNLDAFLGEFAKAKPNMVRANNSEGGSGAGENRTTQTVIPEKKVDYSKMTPDEMRALTSKVISRQYTQRS